MVLDGVVKDFLEDRMDLVDSGDWEEVYRVFDETYAVEKRNIGNLTDALITAGINPLEGKTHVENYMFYESEQSEIILPDTIQTIGVEAFSKTLDLKSVYIPKSVWNIGYRAFRNAGLAPFPFKIIYEATRAEWDAINKDNFWMDRTNVIITCLGDGGMIYK